MIKMQRLERVVGADAVARGLGGEFRAKRGLLIVVAARFVGGDDEIIVGFAGDGEEIGHGVCVLDWRAIQAIHSVFRKSKTRKTSGNTPVPPPSLPPRSKHHKRDSSPCSETTGSRAVRAGLG